MLSDNVLSGMGTRTGSLCHGRWSSWARAADPVTGNRFKWKYFVGIIHVISHNLFVIPSWFERWTTPTHWYRRSAIFRPTSSLHYSSCFFAIPHMLFLCPYILVKVQRQELRTAVQLAAREGGHPNEEERREGRLERDAGSTDRQPACPRENCRAENHLRWNYVQNTHF